MRCARSGIVLQPSPSPSSPRQSPNACTRSVCASRRDTSGAGHNRSGSVSIRCAGKPQLISSRGALESRAPPPTIRRLTPEPRLRLRPRPRRRPLASRLGAGMSQGAGYKPIDRLCRDQVDCPGPWHRLPKDIGLTWSCHPLISRAVIAFAAEFTQTRPGPPPGAAEAAGVEPEASAGACAAAAVAAGAGAAGATAAAGVDAAAAAGVAGAPPYQLLTPW